MNDVKKARKQIDIFIRRLILLCNKCSALKEHLSTSNASGEFNMDILTDTVKCLKRSERSVKRYLDLDKSIEILYGRMVVTECMLTNTPTYLFKRLDTYSCNQTSETIDKLDSVITLSKEIIYNVCYLVPIVGHKYLVEADGIASFTAPVDKGRVLGREC